ncbi:hypothetical protein [Aeromonas salmonicida]|jgi:phosphopantetheinyl transferase (holo-ACP synthase)|uniref:hypothetical protein n=1 Tax=Aeromonas salmonicida TaxID=645 RepID=UPI001788A636|nr:hypothetical protein [Aeromonas salmonicida]QOI95893.1 hypothetical protein G7042_23650 [Aeromonas salmonicida subsp. masoucida]
MKLKQLFVSCSLALSLTACVNVPSEAPDLSIELGKRIQLLEQSHKSLVNQFFEEKRRLLEVFLYDVWLPDFAERFFAKEGISKVWDQIVHNNNKNDRLRFILEVAPKVQQALNAERERLLRPLNDLERQLLTSLSTEYSNAKAINNTLTSYLTSVSDISGTRQRYLDMTGITEDKYSNYLDDVNNIVADLTVYSQKAEEYESKSGKYVEKFNELKNKL